MTGAVARSNAANARTSLVMSPSWDHSRDYTGTESINDVGNRVKFSEEPEIKVMSPVADDEFHVVDRSPSPISVTSVASSVSSEPSASSVAKVLASRLSFWNRSSKKNSAKTPDVESPRVSVDEDGVQPLDALIHEDMPEPQEVLDRIIETVAPSPATMGQKYTELEAKILRQTVKEFAKGEMYFAYDFGAPIHLPLKKFLSITLAPDITHSLQHKQEQLAKAQKQNTLLAELNALDISAQSTAQGEGFDVLSEPSPTHPLWHRVDRQFWWNEHLSKPFIDGKVLNRFISRNMRPLTHSQLLLARLVRIATRARVLPGGLVFNTCGYWACGAWGHHSRRLYHHVSAFARSGWPSVSTSRCR